MFMKNNLLNLIFLTGKLISVQIINNFVHDTSRREELGPVINLTMHHWLESNHARGPVKSSVVEPELQRTASCRSRMEI
jgi:hypothetical protein